MTDMKGHKANCKCPVCRAGRGENLKTKQSCSFDLNIRALAILKATAKKKGISQASVLEQLIFLKYDLHDTK